MTEEDFNKKWDTRAIIEETVKSMGVHNQPAPLTLKILSEVTAKLDKLIDDFHDHKTKMENHIEHSLEWEKDAKPVIEMGKNVQGFGKVSLYILGFFASISGAVLLIVKNLHEK